MATTINNASYTLTAATPAVISEAKFNNAIRAVLVLTNTEAAGGSTVYIAVGQEAATNKGIVLSPGQSFTWSMDSGYRPPLDRVFAISAGTPTIAIYEEIITN